MRVSRLTLGLSLVILSAGAARAEETLSPAPPPVSAYAAPPAYASPPAYAPPPGYGAAPAYAPAAAAPVAAVASTAGFHQHDGFFARGHFGIGATSLSSSRGGVKTTLSGGGVAMGGAVGGVVAHDLILYGAFFATDVGNPNLEVGGTSTPTNVGEIGFGGFGPGVAYYFEPLNLYLSGTLGLCAFHVRDGSGDRLGSSKTGLAFELAVGKEWWVSHDWGLGIAADVVGGSMKDQDDPTLTWSAGALSLLFSATYN
jgi:hypothetical protein